MKCGCKGCTAPATHHLVVKVWAKGFAKTSTPITSVIGLMFCEEHAKAEAKSKALIGDEFFSVVDAMTAKLGRMPVDRASLELIPTEGDAHAALAGLKATG